MSYPVKPAAPPAEPASGIPQSCRFTRSELTKSLADCGYGQNQMMYKAYFRDSGHGDALCASCGLQIGHHPDQADPVVAVPADPPAAPADPIMDLPPPNATVDEFTVIPGRGSVTKYPLHWVGAAWYAPLLEYVGVSRTDTTVSMSTLGRRGKSRMRTAQIRQNTHAFLKFKCMLNVSGVPCEHVFETYGVTISNVTGAAVGPVNLMSTGNNESIDAHMERVHGLKHMPAGRFATGLFECCEDPAAVLTCPLAFHPCPCGILQMDQGFSVCCANHKTLWGHTGCCGEPLIPTVGQTVIASAALNEQQCHGAMCGNACMIVVLPHLIVMGALFFVGSLVTLFGFPCNSDAFPPLLCYCCYAHRRELVRRLGSDETNCETRAKSVFCCLCSEVQVWRELKASGVWPGLLCCTASDKDRAYMSQAAVRERYSIDGPYSYAVKAVSAEGERLLSAVEGRMFHSPAPKICYVK
jgi:hypothetical protein